MRFSQFYKWLTVLLVILVFPLRSLAAASDYSDLYISISDAIMETKKGDDAAAEAALREFKENWQGHSSESKLSSEIDDALQDAMDADAAVRGQELSRLSKALHALEKEENPVDEQAEREKFGEMMEPALADLQQAVDSGSLEQMEEANRQFIATWTKNERPVREQNITAYGAIETSMAFMRISLAEENPDLSLLKSQYEELQATVDRFVAGDIEEQKSGDVSLATLIGLLDDSSKALREGQPAEAKKHLKSFIQIWPSVEGEVRMKNATLYTKIENELPLMIGQLTNEGYDTEKADAQLQELNRQIALLQSNDQFGFWDSALILLREGLEALLVIMALLSFLTNADQRPMKKWVYAGAAAGILLSIAAAVLMSTIFHSATVGNERELLEGYVGLAAAALMIGVGIWMHQKSSVAAWNRYISKQMGRAISTGSIFAMASVSFLAVFREGAETIVFYAGIAPKMPVWEFIAGIVLAIAILAVIAVVLMKMSHKLPIHRLFAVATVLIYLLAFKMIGVSLHTLQLMNVINTSVLPKLPVIDWIGFYPTNETIIGQLILLIVVVAAAWVKKSAKSSIA